MIPMTEEVTFFQVYSSSAPDVGRSFRNQVPSGLISKDFP